MIGNFLRMLAEDIRRAVAASHTPDVAGPFLVADLYWRDLDGKPDWSALFEATWGPDVDGARHLYNGAILKATEGASYYPTAIDWFKRSWKAVRASERYGVDFVRGAYHYLRFDVDGERQADYYLRTVESAGGWGPGDVLPIVDIEFGGASSRNRKTARATVERNARAWVAKVKRVTGRGVILYGGASLGELGIRDRLGASWLWPASYTARMNSREATSIGWTLSEVAMWQYTDGRVAKAVTTRGTVLPRTVPGFGAVDCSVFLAGQTLPDFLHVLCGDGPSHP